MEKKPFYKTGPGYLVVCASGCGRTFFEDAPYVFASSKQPVYLMDDTHTDYLLNNKGEVIKVLCNPATVKIVGNID